MASDVPATWFLYFAAAVFAIGLLGVLVRRNPVAVLMAIEIMLNAANVNFVAFWRHASDAEKAGALPLSGVMMGIFVITLAAAEVAVGIALILLCYRYWRAADVDRYDSLSG